MLLLTVAAAHDAVRRASIEALRRKQVQHKARLRENNVVTSSCDGAHTSGCYTVGDAAADDETINAMSQGWIASCAECGHSSDVSSVNSALDCAKCSPDDIIYPIFTDCA